MPNPTGAVPGSAATPPRSDSRAGGMVPRRRAAHALGALFGEAILRFYKKITSN